ncbi:hypothetical protein BGZ60DRAFT_238228 [Tricladium varicosporioides]|nr:hypothetical protein BGZ60DRAFT_238228 [Hymenoscyphus varicosporioides]
MKEEGADMSHVSISRSYAVLVGLEAYVKTRRRGKKFIAKFLHHRDKIIAPEEVAKKQEEQRDKSESAALERKFLEAKRQAEEEEREENRAGIKLMQKLHIKPTTPQHGGKAGGEEGTAAAVEPPQEGKRNCDIQAPGAGLENAIRPEETINA